MSINHDKSSHIQELFGSVSKPCTPSVHIKIAGKWMFIPLKMVLVGIDPYPHVATCCYMLVYMLVLRIECQSHISSDLALKIRSRSVQPWSFQLSPTTFLAKGRSSCTEWHNLTCFTDQSGLENCEIKTL